MNNNPLRKSTAVAQDRYRKQTWEHDQVQAASGYTKAGISGAAIGAMVRKKTPIGKAAMVGAGAGILAQALVRHATGKTRDQFGDRSHGGKRVDQVLPLAGEVGAAVIGYRKLAKLKGKLPAVHFAVVQASALEKLGLKLGDINWSRVGRSTAVGAGALGAAGALAGAVVPSKGESRVESAAGGAVKDGIFGGALYGISEPLLKKSLLKKGERLLSVRTDGRVISFDLKTRQIFFRIPLKGEGTDPVLPHHSEHEARTKAGTFEPYEKSYYNGNKDRTGKTVGWGHVGFVKAQYRQAVKLQRHARRGAALGTDLVGAARGESKVDSRGRPLKREWQKAWVKNAAGAAVGLAGIAVAKHTLKRNPAMRADLGRAWAGIKGEAVTPRNPVLKKVVGARNAVMDKVSDVTSGRVGSKIGGAWKKATDWDKHFEATAPALVSLAAKLNLIGFDIQTDLAGWDLRDARGRSARVYAPGARARDRREKKWHERVDNIRRIAVGGAVGAGALGVAGGVMIGRSNPKLVRSVVKTTKKKIKGITSNIVHAAPGIFKRAA